MKFADVVKSGEYVPTSTKNSPVKCNKKSFMDFDPLPGIDKSCYVADRKKDKIPTEDLEVIITIIKTKIDEKKAEEKKDVAVAVSTT